jgi:hypothetical protein
VNAVLNLWVPQNCGKLPSVLTTGGLSSGAQLRRVRYSNTPLELILFFKGLLKGNLRISYPALCKRA